MKTIDQLLSQKMMTLVRSNSQSEGQAMADALVEAGVKVIEITLTTPGALKIIERLLKNIFKRNNIQNIGTVSQNFFLQKLGIMERADQIIKKQDASASKNLILSINKLINPKVMGNTFHALAFSNKNCKFNLGFI